MTTGPCGTYAGYNGHRSKGEPVCPKCAAASAAYQRSLRARQYLNRGNIMVDATGTRRRLEALVRLGWTQEMLGERLGISFGAVHRMRTRTWVWPTTAARVITLYDELSMTPGPSTSAAKRAAAKGWPPPLAWNDDTIDDPKVRPTRMVTAREGPAFDEIAVERACRGDRVHLRPVERKEAVRRLTAVGLSAAEIALRLDVTDRSVTRHRSSAA